VAPASSFNESASFPRIQEVGLAASLSFTIKTCTLYATIAKHKRERIRKHQATGKHYFRAWWCYREFSDVAALLQQTNHRVLFPSFESIRFEILDCLPYEMARPEVPFPLVPIPNSKLDAVSHTFTLLPHLAITHSHFHAIGISR
jgi:hypothetical protein